MKSSKPSPIPGSRGLHVRPIALGVAAALLTLGLSTSKSYALPVGEQVTAGMATVHRTGSSVTVTQSTPNAAINWQAFGIAPGEAVRFSQPGAGSVVLNRVVGQDPSQILGSLSSNGQVFLLNPNGVLFGAGAQVSIGGLVASTLSMSDADFMAGRHVFARVAGALTGSVVNQAAIVVANGGYVALIAPQVTNAGSIDAPAGAVALAAGDKVTLTLANGSLLGMTVDQGALNALVENRGAIRAGSGMVVLTAKAMDQVTRSLINSSGIIEAGAISSTDGVVRLEASDVRHAGTIVAGDVGIKASHDITLEPGSNISAGSTVAVIAGGTASVSGVVEARSVSGNGGRIEILGDLTGIFGDARIDASGRTGGGTILVGGDVNGGAIMSGGVALPASRRTVIGSNAKLIADAIESGDGGKVVLWSDDYTGFYGSISARGGALSGNGGFVETSSVRNLQALGSVDASAPHGAAGQWLLDPNNITIQTAGPDANVTGNPNFTTTNDNAIVTTGSIQAALNAGTSVTVTTSSPLGFHTQPGNITVADAIAKTLGSAATLTLNASNDITFNAGAIVTSTVGALGLTLNAAGAINTLQNVNLLGGTLTLNATGNGTQAGVISGTTSVVKSGAGTFTLSSTNTYTGATTISAGGTLQVGNDSAVGTGTLILNGGTLRGDGTARTLGNAVSLAAASSTIAGASDLTLGGALTHTRAGNTTLTVSNTGLTTLGSVALSNSTTNRTVTFAGTGNTNITGVISDGGTATASALTKTGTGTLTLSGTNTYGGATTVTAGTLQVANDSAVGTGTLILNGGTLRGDGTARTLGNAVSLALSSTIAGASDLTLSGALTNTTSNPTLTVNNTGLTTLGSVALSNSGTNRTVTFSGTGDTSIAGVIENGGTSAASALAKAGTGTLTLRGVNTYRGATTITAGTLALGVTDAVGPNSAVTVAAAGTFDLNGFSDTIGSLAGAGLVTSGAAGAVSLSAGSNNTSTTFSGSLQDGSGTVSLTKAGTNTLTLSGANTYTGATTINAGTLTASNATALGSTAAGTTVAIGATLNVNAVAIGAEDLTLNGTGVSAVGALTGTGTGSVAGAVSLATDTSIGGTGTLTLSGVVSGASTLTKVGTGTLVLSGANTYTGATTINAGTLRIAADSGLGSVPGAATPGHLSFGGGTLATTADFTLNANRGIALAGAGTINTATGTSLAYDGIVSGPGGLTKSGTGTLTLSGLNTYTGATAVAAGTLSINSIGNVGGGASAIGAPTTVAGGTISLGAGGGVAGTGTLAYTGSAATTDRVVNLAGTSGGGRLDASGSGALVFTSDFTATVAGSKVLTLAGSNTDGNAVSGAIVNSGGGNTAVTKAGTGLWVLSGASTYSGATTLSAGTLRVTGSDAALGAGTLSLTGGTLELVSDTGLNLGRNTSMSAATTIVSKRLTPGAGVTHTLGTLNITTLLPLTLTQGGNITSGTAGLTFGATTLNRSPTLNVGAGTLLSLGALTDVDSARIITKAGGGTLVFTDRAASWAHSGEGLIINEGTVRLDASDVFSDGSGTLTNVTVNANVAGATALLDLNGNNQSIGTLTFGGTGATSSSVNRIVTGTGTLTLGGTVTYSATNNPLGATISGNLDLGGATRTFNIGNSANAAEDLGISAVISGSGGLTKTGTGLLNLSGVNTYAGANTIGAGTLLASNASALGSTASGTTVANGATLEIANGIAIGAEALNVSGSGVGGNGALTLASGSGSYAGAITLGESASLGGNGSLTLGGTVEDVASGTSVLTQAGSGTLILSNTVGATNALAGVTTSAGQTTVINGGSVRTTGAQAYGSVVTTGGALTLTSTAGGDITAINSGNAYNGNLVLATLGAARIASANALALGASSVGTLEAQALAGDLVLNGAITASGSGDSIVLAASGNFTNNAGAGALTATNGRWLVYSTSPAGSTENGLTAAAGSGLPRLYNRTYAANAPASIAEPGNHLIYSAQPTLTVTADDKSRIQADANPAFTYTPGGYVVDDGVADTAATAGFAGEASLATGATSASGVGTYAINAGPGTLLSGAGYGLTFVNGTLSILPRPNPVTPDDNTPAIGNVNPAFTGPVDSVDVAALAFPLYDEACDSPAAALGEPRCAALAATPGQLRVLGAGIRLPEGVLADIGRDTRSARFADPRRLGPAARR